MVVGFVVVDLVFKKRKLFNDLPPCIKCEMKIFYNSNNCNRATEDHVSVLWLISHYQCVINSIQP